MFKKQKMGENSKHEILDIVKLLDKNPLTKLTGEYNSILVKKIKERFNTEEQCIFLTNLYCYVNYDNTKDFVVKLEGIWKWLGFTRLGNCKNVLIKNFVESVDYRVEKLASATSEASLHGGQNKETILLTIKCFKKLCLKAGTKKADEIHDYYINLEEVINETVYEQSEQLINKLKDKDIQLKLKDQQRTKNIVDNFEGKRIVYIGYADKINGILKIGITSGRLGEHKNTYDEDFTYEYVYESLYYEEIEKRIKNHPELSVRKLIREYNGKNRVELFQLDNIFTIENVNIIVLEIKNIVEQMEMNKDKDSIISQLQAENSELKLKISPEIIKTDVKDKEIATLKNKISHLRPETPYIARNIVTGEEKEFKSYAAAYDISKIGPHQIRDNYLDKPVQCRGWTFRSPGKPYWKVPENFIFNQDQKASAHMIMFKSVHKTTGVETYFNSITEASEYISKSGVSFENSETNRRTLNRLVNEDKPTKHPYLAQFSWSKIESCGSWTYPDGRVENCKK